MRWWVPAGSVAAVGLVTLLALVVCYPIAFWMAQRATTGQLSVALLLIIILIIILT